MNDGYLNIDVYKKRALDKLALKKEPERTYPITKRDLIKVYQCPLCKYGDLIVLTEVYLKSRLNFFQTSACPKCLFTFRTISPSLSWFKKCWAKIYDHKKLEVFSPDTEEIRKRRYQIYFDMFLKYAKPGKLLDIGAGYGTGSNLFKTHGFQVQAVEPEISKIAYIKKFFGIQVVAQSIQKFISKKNNYDFVVFAQCLEHIDRPDYVMKHLKNIMQPNGLLYAELPIIWNYVNWNDAFYLPHKSNFSEENFINLVHESGFKIMKKFYVEQHLKTWDLGVLLKISQKNNKTPLKNNGNIKTLRDILALYRKDLPIKWSDNNSILKYNVFNIEQFFQILDLRTKKMIKPKSIDDFIEFKNI
ncbi:MAG: hypothetical protein A2817_00090 [Candidatus Yanofskybacteria bacterium RIFCSPHIGHO2_01_FULL_39_8b]|uniref:Methyltransferase type 11 domain-containing protein n=1 Tax=Candidatus Yanofskybacteria bacterium RIFCSPHIGHO2_01_FULL_39_8b TaxID=1802659 RepID=A0A1F8E823_9BACT|nr:MAG: hypothetical protein A2817_00090 [Candidatus Yanofskybacteria bacterium RIFCSPHIGHO2_01_FULL_39_8b]